MKKFLSRAALGVAAVGVFALASCNGTPDPTTTEEKPTTTTPEPTTTVDDSVNEAAKKLLANLIFEADGTAVTGDVQLPAYLASGDTQVTIQWESDSELVKVGIGNTASGVDSAVIGGSGSKVSSNHSAVIGSIYGTASGDRSAVIGGESNSANGNNSVIISGVSNSTSTSGSNSVVIGGNHNTALAYQLKTGHYSKDGTAGTLSGTTGDTFIAPEIVLDRTNIYFGT